MNRRNAILIVSLAGTLAALSWAFLGARKGTPDGDQVIAMTAENFKFTPPEVRVKAGRKLTLKVTSIDDKHGIAFKLIPEGQPEGSPAGLQFGKTPPDWVLEKGKEVTIEFTALRPGRYEFACSVFCGMGHNGMLGRVIVE